MPIINRSPSRGMTLSQAIANMNAPRPQQPRPNQQPQSPSIQSLFEKYTGSTAQTPYSPYQPAGEGPSVQGGFTPQATYEFPDPTKNPYYWVDNRPSMQGNNAAMPPINSLGTGTVQGSQVLPQGIGSNGGGYGITSAGHLPTRVSGNGMGGAAYQPNQMQPQQINQFSPNPFAQPQYRPMGRMGGMLTGYQTPQGFNPFQSQF